jgi:hypothetical protein
MPKRMSSGLMTPKATVTRLQSYLAKDWRWDSAMPMPTNWGSATPTEKGWRLQNY